METLKHVFYWLKLRFGFMPKQFIFEAELTRSHFGKTKETIFRPSSLETVYHTRMYDVTVYCDGRILVSE